MNGPSFGGLASNATVTPYFLSASEATGPMEATTVRLRPARSATVWPILSASANRL